MATDIDVTGVRRVAGKQDVQSCRSDGQETHLPGGVGKGPLGGEL